MPTVVNNPSTTTDTSSVNWVIAFIVIIAMFFLLFYGLPLLRSGGSGSISRPDTQQSQPQQQNPQSGSESRIDVNVPERVDINTGM